MRIHRIGEVKCKVGEGPLWDASEQALYFVDLIGQRLWRHAPATQAFSSWDFDQVLAAATLMEDGGILLALADGFYEFDKQSGAVRLVARPLLAAGTQFNDAKVDRQGRFVAGSMERTMQQPLGALYRLETNGTVSELDSGFIIPNGPCWSPDGGTFYCADSIPKLIHAYDYDSETGALAGKRTFASTSELGGIPDGATVDASGRLWMAVLGPGGKVVCFDAQGRLERAIEMPTKWVSSVMFGGPRLDKLYVTSLDPTTVGIPGDAGAGALYVIEDLDAVGLPETRARRGWAAG